MKPVFNTLKFESKSFFGILFRISIGLIIWFCFLCKTSNGQTISEEFPDFNEAKREPTKVESNVPVTIFEQFIFGMSTFESGKARLLNATGDEIVPQISIGTMMKVGAVIETPHDSSAEIKLGCGSTIRLAPQTRVKILPFAIDLQNGSCLTKHVGQYFPMKIQGAATLLISKDSVVSVERVGDKAIAEVLVGKLRTPGINSAIVAGQTIEASGKAATLLKNPPEPRAWDPPSLHNIMGVLKTSESILPPSKPPDAVTANIPSGKVASNEVLNVPLVSDSPEDGSESNASFLGQDDK